MGTTIVILLTASTLFFVAGAPVSHLLLLLAVGGVISYMTVGLRDYQIDRLVSFVDPGSDPQGGGFQIIQLLIALGSGGPMGLGWSESRQKFFYVPSSHTDGVFAILGEEVGFVGLMFILGVFAFFIYRSLKVTMEARDRFATLVGIGIVSWIAFQSLINIGGITRTIPLTGVPLPFLSYGGSSLIALMSAVGVLLSISRYSTAQPFAQQPKPATRPRPPARRGRRPRALEREPA
jgi:cell division protein FtsW